MEFENDRQGSNTGAFVLSLGVIATCSVGYPMRETGRLDHAYFLHPSRLSISILKQTASKLRGFMIFKESSNTTKTTALTVRLIITEECSRPAITT